MVVYGSIPLFHYRSDTKYILGENGRWYWCMVVVVHVIHVRITQVKISDITILYKAGGQKYLKFSTHTA